MRDYTMLQKEAFIYLPGLDTNPENQSLETIAYRFKKALDINIIDPAHKFHIEVKKINYGKGDKLVSNVAIIYRDNDLAPPAGAESNASYTGKTSGTPVFTIYELNYADVLTSRFKESGILFKTLLLFSTIIQQIPLFIFVFFSRRRSGLSLRDKFQSGYVLLIFLILSTYGILVFSSLLVTINVHFEGVNNFYSIFSKTFSKYYQMTTAGSFIVGHLRPFYHSISRFFNFIYDLVFAYKNYIMASVATLLLLLPNFKNFITNTAIDYLCLINYLNTGERKQNIVGKLEELLEYICESGEGYAKINLLAYSFGSIIAIDALRPQDGNVSYRMKTKIDRLVTIGCPFDFIRVYWENYYTDRKNADIAITDWFNVYSAVDILSSNFRDDSQKREAEAHLTIGKSLPSNISYDLINNNKLTFMDMLLLQGLRAHRMYWDDEEYSASCFSALLQAIYFPEVMDNKSEPASRLTWTKD